MQIEAEITPHKSFPQKVKELLVKNDIVIFTAAAYAFAILSAPLLIGSLAPAPFSPLTTIPNWASWFDIWITFPALSILCVIPFRGSSRIAKVTIVSLVAIIPLYLIFASYYFAYALAPFGFAIFGTPLTLLVPAATLIILLATPALNSIILSRNISRSVVPSAKTNFYFVAAAVSLSLAILQAAIRVAYDGTYPLTAWVSDIGVGVEAGARDLLHGINPYVAGVPPWGGPAQLIWGPVSLVMIAPFSALLSPGWAAHASSIFYGIVTAVGVWKCVKILSPRMALPAAMLFLALPTTSWVVESGTTLHIIGTLFLVWSLYMFLSKKYVWAGALGALGFLAMLIPGALIVPFLLYSKNKTQRLGVALGFLVPVVLALAGIFLVFKSGATTLLTGGLLTSLQTGYALNLIFTPSADAVLRFIPSAALVFWFIYRSLRIQDDKDLLTVVSIFLLLLPFAIGFYLPFFFIWGSAIAIMALFSYMSAPANLRTSQMS